MGNTNFSYQQVLQFTKIYSERMGYVLSEEECQSIAHLYCFGNARVKDLPFYENIDRLINKFLRYSKTA